MSFCLRSLPFLRVRACVRVPTTVVYMYPLLYRSAAGSDHLLYLLVLYQLCIMLLPCCLITEKRTNERIKYDTRELRCTGTNAQEKRAVGRARYVNVHYRSPIGYPSVNTMSGSDSTHANCTGISCAGG